MNQSSAIHVIARHEPASPLALVFTDVVGSTAAKRAESLGSNASTRDRAYLDAIQTRHLAVIRNALAEHNGKEVMTIGDAFFLTFEDPVDALRCAAAIQQRLADRPIDTPNGPLRLRIGIHVGTPEFFENSWHGTDVDTAARVESVGSPYQVVVSDAARNLIGNPVGIRFRPLGTFALKGIGNLRLWDADYDQNGLRTPAVKSNEQKRRRRRLTTTIVSALLLATILPSAWYLWHRYQQQKTTALLSGKKDTIIVADFENKTGEPIFDAMLTQALWIQLQQSPVLHLESPEQLRQSVQYLGKPADTPITAEIAREIGEREGIKAYLVGNISRLGESYIVTANAVNTRTGDYIASEQATAASKDHVMDALGTVATAMRGHLGESLESIQKLDVPFSQATTPSLEAFRAFAMGDVEHAKGHELPEAAGFYRRAVELDPNFAMAWLKLGVTYLNSGSIALASEYLTKAFALSDHVSEREKLSIQGLYQTRVTGDLRRGVEVLELATRIYPLDFSYFVNLGTTQSFLGQTEAANISQRRAIALAPDNLPGNLDLLQGLVILDLLKEADELVSRLGSRRLDGTGCLNLLYTFYALEGDASAMSRVTARVEGRPDEFLVTQSVAAVDEFFGRYREAGDAYRRAERQTAKAEVPDSQAGTILLQVSGMALAGNCDTASKQIRDALALDKSKATLVAAAYAAGLCNEPEIASPLINRLTHDYPDDTLIREVDLPITRASLALSAHKPQVTLQELSDIRPYDLVSIGPYLQGLAYLELRDGQSAVSAFQRATIHRGAALNFPLQDYGQAQLGLARAYTLTGDKTAATKTYEALFNTWKNADADLPQLLAAKQEYAALHTRP